MIRARTRSEGDTRELAGAIAKTIRPRDLLVLSGSMGAGKTAFTKGFGAALGVHDGITSPTFVLMQTYDGTLPIHHVDIYRLDHLQEVIDLGLMELLDDGGVALVEWGQLAEPVLPRDYLEVRINPDDRDESMRHFELSGVGTAWQQRVPGMREHLGPWIVEDVPQ